MTLHIKLGRDGRTEQAESGALAPLRELAFYLLSLLEPVVTVVLSAAGIVGLLTCLSFHVGPPRTHFPMPLMLGLSLGSLGLLGLYYGLLRALDPGR
jgi:hypothetical protein